MYSSLNLQKPITRTQRIIEEKCGRIRPGDEVPMYPNIMDRFPQTRRHLPPNSIMTVGTPLSKSNVKILEKILGDNKIYSSPFVRTNMTEILKIASNKKGAKLLEAILTPETINKIDTQRRLIKNNPRPYVHDKDIVQYANTPAALNSLFKDINILKAAYVLEPKALDSLFRMDITSEVGSDYLRYIGTMNLEELNRMKSTYKGIVQV